MLGELSNFDLKRIVKNENIGKIFLGVFPRDRLPLIKKYPCCFIANNQSSNKKGEHWIAFFYDKNKFCTFFVSYGLEPSLYRLISYLDKTSNGYDFNINQYQSFFSKSCGYFCLLFLVLKSININLDTFLTSNFDQNEKILECLF